MLVVLVMEKKRMTKILTDAKRSGLGVNVVEDSCDNLHCNDT